MLKTIKNFITEDIWTISDKQLSIYQSIGLNALKVSLLAIQGFKRDLCPLRASALTLYTLLSIVPVIALLFGIAKGFGFEKKLEQQLLEQSSEQSSMMLQLIEFSQNMLASTKGGLLAGIGIVVLFWTVIKVIGNIEESFNHIWKIQQGRALARKLSDYLSLMMLAPVLLISSSSLTVFVKTKITWLIEVLSLPEFGARVVFFAMSLSPLLIMILLFSFIFVFMPNKQIKLKAAVIAGIVTAVLFQSLQWAYITLQIGASSYNAIYGSFAALPLFLIWLQMAWVVVLLGCEVSYYVQNFASYRHNDQFNNLSLSLSKSIALLVCQTIVKNFAAAEPPLNAEQISKQLSLPVSVVQTTLSSLLAANLIVELNVLNDEEMTYHPARDINTLTNIYVIDALESSGRNQVPDITIPEVLLATSVNVKPVLLNKV